MSLVIQWPPNCLSIYLRVMDSSLPYVWEKIIFALLCRIIFLNFKLVFPSDVKPLLILTDLVFLVFPFCFCFWFSFSFCLRSLNRYRSIKCCCTALYVIRYGLRYVSWNKFWLSFVLCNGGNSRLSEG